MIEQTKQEVEHKYCVKNGYEHDAVVSIIFIQWLYIIHSFTKFSSIPKNYSNLYLFISVLTEM